MNSTTNINIAYRAVILALLAMLASATSLMAQEFTTSAPCGALDYEANSQVADHSQVPDEPAISDLALPEPILVEPPEVNIHTAYWEEARMHPVLMPPVVLAPPAPTRLMWWDSIETLLRLRDQDMR
ncbi:MAG: hypothetical protein ABFS14_04845 [Gemmatimonadota bacterium]